MTIILRIIALICALVLGTLTLASQAEAQGTKKPNILIIWGDDIGQFNVSAYNMGMMGYRTPSIDSIAREGAMAQETVTAASVEVDPLERSRAVRGFDEAIDCPMLEPGSEHLAVFMRYVQDYPPRMVSVGRGTDELMCEVGTAGCSWPPTR